MSNPNTLKSERTSTPDRVGDFTDEFMGETAEDSPLDDTLRLKMRYMFVLGRLDVDPDNRPKWEKKRHELEEKLMENDIRPSTLLK